jgi:hypothetical protein
MKGAIHYLYAFDIAGEIRTAPIREVLSKKVFPFEIKVGSTAPRDVRFYRPLTLELAEEEIETNAGRLRLRPIVKIFEVGAISITYKVPFEAATLGELIPFHQLAARGGDELHAKAEKLCRQVTENLRPFLTKPNEERRPAEPYTIFAIETIEGVPAGGVPEWSNTNRTEIAALLLEEAVPERLAEDQVRESWRHAFSYTSGDMTIVDWDAALVVDQSGYFDDVAYMLELANLQLEEFQVLDDRLDAFFTRAYDDLERYYAVKRLLPTPEKILRALRAIRMDITKMSEEVGNITKFVGDWYLARVYLACRDRFHLGQWEASVDKKVSQLDGLYRMVHTEINERRMLLLEAIIVALFIFDVVALLFVRK